MDKQKRIIKEFVQVVKTAYPNSKIMLFGSRAKGTAKKDSDYDFLVISSLFERIEIDKRMATLYRLKQNIPAAMDILCATPKEAKAAKLSVISEALREGIDVSSIA